MDVMTHMAPNMGVRSSGLIMLSLQALSLYFFGSVMS